MTTTIDAQPAVRNLSGFYPEWERGKVAADGSTLDQFAGDGTVIASAWYDPACRWCIREPFRHMCSRFALKCKTHGVLERPAKNAFPPSERERDLGEQRAWYWILDRLATIPSRYHDASFEAGRAAPALKAMKEHLDNEGASPAAVVSGPTGVGKTYALVATLRHQLVGSPKSPAAFFTMPALVRALITDTSDAVFAKCIKAEILAIDDVGAAYIKEGGLAESLIEEIICTREAEELETYLSTNLILPKFCETLGDRVADRIRGDWCTWYSLPGESLRRKPRGKPA